MVRASTNSHCSAGMVVGVSPLRSRTSSFALSGATARKASRAFMVVVSLNSNSSHTVCSIGPGIVGTGTRFGHGGLAAAEAANAALALGGVPVIAVRVSAADERPRHRGVSHHTDAVLSLVRGDAVVPQDGKGWREACEGLPLSHMGRGPDDDPEFFAAAYAAGAAARDLVR